MIISQKVAVLIDGNNIEISIHNMANDPDVMCSYDLLIHRIVGDRTLNRLIYFKEGKNISAKLAERLHRNFYGTVKSCRKNADIRLTIEAIQLIPKVDTMIILSGDSDYIELVQHLKSNGIRVEIASIRSTTSQALLDEADYYHEIIAEDWFKIEK
jgi:uncharacterized LabA/DUF88 family protein